MFKYANIILLFNVLFVNAFVLTQVNKIYFANTKHITRKSNILLNNNNKAFNNTMNASGDTFPSFYEFLRTHSIQNIKESKNEEDEGEGEGLDEEEDEGIEEGEDVETIKADFLNFKANLNETIETSETSNTGKDFANKLNSKHLKLLTAFSAIQWARTWIYDMVHIKENFPAFMYQDMYKMCDFGSVNVSKRFFYIGYYPPKVDPRKGPYYIGAFEVNPQEQAFIARIIIQNPYFCVENSYAKEDILFFKKELQALCVEATVIFKFSELKNTSFERYYYSWLYEE